MNDVVRVSVAIFCVLTVAISVGVATTAATDSTATDSTLATTAVTEEENETVRHQNPDEYAADGDSSQLEAWLTDRMGSQLQDSTVSLSEGEYEQARNFVGEEYRERLSQYVEVAGETDTDGGDDDDEDDVGSTLEETGEEQERLADLIEEYEATFEEYEDARQAGDDELALELARELEALADEIEAAGGTVTTNYEFLENETGQDFSDASANINESTDDVEQSQTIVRQEQFIETELVLDPDGETASFLDPLTIDGELQAADGSTIANENLSLEVDGDPVDVRTDAAGSFDVEFQPTTQPQSLSNVTVTYIPDRQSTYLGTETDVDLSIEQVEPTIATLDADGTTAYDEHVAVAGEFSAGGDPIDDVPLTVEIDGTPIGTVSATDGTFDGDLRVPAAVSDGTHELTVTLPEDELALASTAASTPITVTETETDLRVDAEPADGDDGNHTVEGTLTTADGDGVADQPIELVVDGESVGSATTDSAGEFSTTVPTDVNEGDERQLAAVYDGAETSLSESRDETTITGATAGGGGSGTGDGGQSSASSWILWMAGIGGLVVAIGAGAVWWRRTDDEPSEPESLTDDQDDRSVPTATATTAESAESDDSGSDATSAVDALLEQAETDLSNERPERAVRTGYSALRQAWPTTADRDSTLTHWEFYHQANTNGNDGHLRSVTTAYEQAAFTPTPLSTDEAATVIETVRTLCGRTDTSPGTDGSATADD